MGGEVTTTTMYQSDGSIIREVTECGLFGCKQLEFDHQLGNLMGAFSSPLVDIQGGRVQVNTDLPESRTEVLKQSKKEYLQSKKEREEQAKQ